MVFAARIERSNLHQKAGCSFNLHRWRGQGARSEATWPGPGAAAWATAATANLSCTIDARSRARAGRLEEVTLVPAGTANVTLTAFPQNADGSGGAAIISNFTCRP
jgi:hypothetical protein